MLVGTEPLLLGLVLGARHALEPDHLAAITTMVGETPDARAAARTGAAWGVGHALAIVLLGGALVALGIRVPPRIALVLELAVAVTLVVLGVSALRARKARARASTAVGFIHGLSGTAAITLVCATTIRSSSTAILFLLVFALGATISMSAMSGLLAKPLSAVARRGDRAARHLRVAGAVVAFAAALLVTVEALRA